MKRARDNVANSTDSLQKFLVIVILVISVVIFWKFGCAIGEGLGKVLYNLRH